MTGARTDSHDRIVSGWEEGLYGDPCRDCGYDWSISQADAVSLVLGTPEAYRELLRGADGHERHPELSWSVVAYVCHVGDNLRIWAERLAGIARGAPRTVAAYDENLLARARAYEGVALKGAIWSLDGAVEDWNDAVGLASVNEVVLVHPELGEQTLLDVLRSNAHDAYHHQWDIRRSLQANAP